MDCKKKNLLETPQKNLTKVHKSKKALKHRTVGSANVPVCAYIYIYISSPLVSEWKLKSHISFWLRSLHMIPLGIPCNWIHLIIKIARVLQLFLFFPRIFLGEKSQVWGHLCFYWAKVSFSTLLSALGTCAQWQRALLVFQRQHLGKKANRTGW